MSLTAAEVAYANKLLERGARRWHGWKVLRWVVVLVGVGMLASAGVTRRLVAPVAVADDGNRTKMTAPVDRAYVEHEINSAKLELMGFAVGISQAALGLVIVAYATTHWSHHLRDGLLVKAMREKFHDELVGAGA